jgi:alanine-synthesizing transaminase
MPRDSAFSRRTDWELTANKLNDELERLRSQKVDFIDLTVSNPTHCGFKYPGEIVKALADPANLFYDADSQGMLKARAEVARFYEGVVDPQSIVLTSSTSEAYAFLLRLLVNPGERVLIGKPSYPLFQYLIELADAEYDFYPMTFDGTWRIDFTALEKAITPTTRVLILVNPNNPTGSYISKDELKKLNALCRKYKLAIVSDEVFFDYRIDAPEDSVSFRNNKDVLSFTLGGLSKSLALPQMKLSWIMASGPEKELKEALNRLEIIADTFLSVNTPVQNALAKWFTWRKDIQGQIIQRLHHNYDMVRKLTQEAAIQCLPSQGGWYATLRLTSIQSEEQWVLDLLRTQHVSVHPGYFFDFEEEGFVVVSLLPKEDKMEQGIKKLLEFAKT